MKFYKITFLTSFLLLSSSSLLQSGTKTSDKVPNTMVQHYHFEIYNKSGKLIYFVLLGENGKDLSQDVYSKQAVTTIDANKKLRLLNIDKPQNSYTILIKPAGTQKSLEFKILSNPARKNIFLTWDDSDPKKKELLRPQTGPLKGLTGKIESGLPLNGNIKQNDIFKLPSF